MSKEYTEFMNRRNEIMKKSVGIDYQKYEQKGIGFDFELMMNDQGYNLEKIIKIQSENMVGNTPLVELKNITAYARKYAQSGKGARIFLKDEAANLSGSFKARRAALAVNTAKELGYKGVIAATSGNYGAAVAALAAKKGLKCIIVQECFDSENNSQPEIIEKARKCEAYGAEVVQLSVGPELFYIFLKLLDETGYFNASLYSPYGIKGIESLGHEIANEVYDLEGKYPEAVVITNAGGGNLTGTARGLKDAGAVDTKIIAASVDLYGLHMASDKDFNRKSFTTGHTGFGIPFSTYPDRSDVPRSAARPLRYMDRYLMVNQGSVFFMTEALAQLEGMERGPAGNTSLAAAFSLAQTMSKEEIIVVQETEYTGAGKHIQPQLSFAKRNGIEVMFGNPNDETPGENIILPKDGSYIKHVELDMDNLRKSYLKRYKDNELSTDDYQFLADELGITCVEVEILLK
ncbi:Tryptophan synthase beta chain [Candidatus Izimaplasma bacterium HR1]|uniref:2-amino-4-oxopentanoate thiolase subunit OrtB n=1 Tax=Candidatus Izimoplasma sp. HR1 TaxID=1541959 RepID=UPI0004F6A862|nr:Tryptophan synthase beta chain [Candidatus Izimaplasma bacterium HR1]